MGAAAAGGAVSGIVQTALPGVGTVAMVTVGGVAGGAGGATERLVASGGKSAGTLTDLAIDVGVGAATALSGAVVGTLIPQSSAAMDAFVPLTVTRLLEGGIMLAGTVLTLAYFQFSASRTADGTVKRNVIFEILAWGGRVFIAITFGVLFAGVYMAALTALLERLSAIINFLRPLFGL